MSSSCTPKRRSGKVHQWLCVAGLMAATGAPSALARPHFTSLDGLRFDYQSTGAGVGSSVGFQLPNGDILQVSNLLIHENPPFTGSALPQAGTSIFAEFDTHVRFRSHIRGHTILQQSMSMDSPLMSLAIFGDATNTGPDARRGFSTEMLSMDLRGGTAPQGMMLRESPTLVSGGRLSMDVAPGGWIVDSFFDIWTELSMDGGQSWIPADGSLRLVSVPTPSVLTPVAMTIAAFGSRRRRRSP